jgi:hypothetical protein
MEGTAGVPHRNERMGLSVECIEKPTILFVLNHPNPKVSRLQQSNLYGPYSLRMTPRKTREISVKRFCSPDDTAFV